MKEYPKLGVFEKEVLIHYGTDYMFTKCIASDVRDGWHNGLHFYPITNGIAEGEVRGYEYDEYKRDFDQFIKDRNEQNS